MKQKAVKNYRNNPRGRFCPCGEPAIKWKWNAWVCVSCDKAEENLNWDLQGIRGTNKASHLEPPSDQH